MSNRACALSEPQSVLAVGVLVYGHQALSSALMVGYIAQTEAEIFTCIDNCISIHTSVKIKIVIVYSATEGGASALINNVPLRKLHCIATTNIF